MSIYHKSKRMDTVPSGVKDVRVNGESIVVNEVVNLDAIGSINDVTVDGVSVVTDGVAAIDLTSKQEVIEDLATIREGAEKGATALQEVPSNYRTSEAQDIIDSEKASKDELSAVEEKIPSIEGLASEEWVEGKGYLTEHQDISGKQDVITDLATIREGAALGATSVQPDALNDFIKFSQTLLNNSEMRLPGSSLKDSLWDIDTTKYPGSFNVAEKKLVALKDTVGEGFAEIVEYIGTYHIVTIEFEVLSTAMYATRYHYSRRITYAPTHSGKFKSEYPTEPIADTGWVRKIDPYNAKVGITVSSNSYASAVHNDYSMRLTESLGFVCVQITLGKAVPANQEIELCYIKTLDNIPIKPLQALYAYDNLGGVISGAAIGDNNRTWITSTASIAAGKYYYLAGLVNLTV